jgi:AraC-like DNA-binding protein
MLINILFIITGLFGFLTTTIILTNYKLNKLMNLSLIIIFILVSIRFLVNGFFYLGLINFYKDYQLNFSKFLIIIIPLFYLYFKNLIVDREGIAINDTRHFVFPLLFLTFNIYFINNKDLFKVDLFYFFFPIYFIYNITYCYLIYRILKDNLWSKKGEVKINKQNALLNNWTFVLFITTILITIRILVSLLLENSYFNTAVVGDVFQWVTALIWMFIFIKIMTSPEILYGYSVFNDKIKKNKISNLKSPIWDLESKIELENLQDKKLKKKINGNIVHYISEIEKYSTEYELFKDPKFSLSDFATKLKIPNSHLTYVYKYHSKISFPDFKKNIRIYHSVHLIETDYLKTNTLDSLAKEVGFASYNPFFTSFKSTTGLSPQKYINEFNEV